MTMAVQVEGTWFWSQSNLLQWKQFRESSKLETRSHRRHHTSIRNRFTHRWTGKDRRCADLARRASAQPRRARWPTFPDRRGGCGAAPALFTVLECKKSCWLTLLNNALKSWLEKKLFVERFQICIDLLCCRKVFGTWLKGSFFSEFQQILS